MKSIESIDKTAKSIGAFDSINYGVYCLPIEMGSDPEMCGRKHFGFHFRSRPQKYRPQLSSVWQASADGRCPVLPPPMWAVYFVFMQQCAADYSWIVFKPKPRFSVITET